MVNNTFYAVANDLMNRAASGAGLEPVTVLDYSSFISAGQQLTNLSGKDLANAFADEIANKVQIALNIARPYNADLDSLNFGTMPPEGVLEIINNQFMNTRAAEFPNLTNGESVDMYVVNKGEQSVDYYFKSEAFQIPVTIQLSELRGAFNSPEAMEAFLYGKVMYALNSKNHAIEVSRYALMAKGIIDATDSESEYVAEPAETQYTAARRYDLVTLYNKIHSTALTSDTAPYDRDFIAFAVSLIKYVRDKMKKASTSYNPRGIKTFTPDPRLKVVAPFDSAITSYLYPDTLHPEFNRLDNYEIVPFLQNENTPYTVNYSNSTTTDNSLVTPPVLAILHDEYAMLEYTMIDDVESTPYNAAGRYTNDWISAQYGRYINRGANFVIFTLE